MHILRATQVSVEVIVGGQTRLTALRQLPRFDKGSPNQVHHMVLSLCWQFTTQCHHTHCAHNNKCCPPCVTQLTIRAKSPNQSQILDTTQSATLHTQPNSTHNKLLTQSVSVSVSFCCSDKSSSDVCTTTPDMVKTVCQQNPTESSPDPQITQTVTTGCPACSHQSIKEWRWAGHP